ncbi:hypothetical protein BLA24_27775 [Streptomyces cinnamoneus]|uniref:Uncharacterized protein n=1 Tax=Streptomyces cinnamoneus TaxID=53446 RepID=A0A2G1XC91_STRCJ|nr:hypothetical protein [Streptomyces cinnamoneus]PHQ48863.1 hypothetical protein BLA24_27775 [Streptomyces cinnamoneus]PPT14490.1 hypothetical protein CYQ11_17865 [Streptomyces cinnamoneus]
MGSRTQAADADARQWEYVTYAPTGETCPACRRKIKPLEPCRRFTVERASAAPVVAYRHAHCGGTREIKR